MRIALNLYLYPGNQEKRYATLRKKSDINPDGMIIIKVKIISNHTLKFVIESRSFKDNHLIDKTIFNYTGNYLVEWE